MTWKYRLENYSPRGTSSCSVVSEKTKARKEKRKVKMMKVLRVLCGNYWPTKITLRTSILFLPLELLLEFGPKRVRIGQARPDFDRPEPGLRNKSQA
ncbi:hypothetical protein MTR_7g029125 [Medicago truncatula]|uniref:Uncharacterized protein n=1 Tax=Medicago truncatula TaxID=3880 RepID=A0A072TX62_MEDTR|nr:hypothetical protein MTR_7g029125 [Medicago truncatula]